MFNPVKSVQTVSEFTTSLKGLIETSHPFINLQGEVSNLRIPYSGHMYFILKDDKAQIRAVLFKGQRRFLQDDFKDGDEIICKGRITVYEPRGDYQIIVDSAQKAGVGTMHIEFGVLKEKLAGEGLFAEDRKKKLPFLSQKICLITSSTGAAVHDFLSIAFKKNPELQVEIMATPMQGDQAPQLIKEALEKVCARDWADVVVLCRGGGSIEDLWAFNNEDLARAIAHAPLPVVSAIGHEVDFTIADFAADIRAPTPTAAAEFIVPDVQDLKKSISLLKNSLQIEILNLLERYELNTQNQIKFLGNPRSILEQQQLKMDYLITQLELAFSRDIPRKKELLLQFITRLHDFSPENALATQKQHFITMKNRLIAAQREKLRKDFEQLQKKSLMLNALSPLAVLGRGYSITSNSNNKQLITSVQDVEINDKISIQLQNGIIEAQTTKITTGNC